MGCLNAFPRRSNFNQDAVAANACGVVLRNYFACLSDGCRGVIGEAGIDFSRDTTGNDLENLLAECDGEALKREVGDR